MVANYGSLPFAEALDFFRQKLNLPTAQWDELLGAAHDRAFVVAGATLADLLADLNAAVLKGQAQGLTLATFKKDFEKIVAERGWTGWTGEGSKGGRAWRARVIYETNLYTSYSAGRFQQMKAVAASRPYWRYRHSDAVTTPRPEHAAWDGKILRHDDPWWAAHAPPNGFGCKCYVETLAARDLKKLGIEPPTADAGKKMPYAGQTDPKTGLPQGVDKGWDYQPGKSYADDLARLKKMEADKIKALTARGAVTPEPPVKPATPAEIEAFVAEVLSNRSNNKGRLVLDVVSEMERQRIQTETGVDVGESSKILLPSTVIHATNEHPNLTPADWRQIADVLREFDGVFLSLDKGRNQELRLAFIKLAGTPEAYGCVVDVAKGKKRGGPRLNVATFYRDHINMVLSLVRQGAAKKDEVDRFVAQLSAQGKLPSGRLLRSTPPAP